jgi:hypothetical protein
MLENMVAIARKSPSSGMYLLGKLTAIRTDDTLLNSASAFESDRATALEVLA